MRIDDIEIESLLRSAGPIPGDGAISRVSQLEDKVLVCAQRKRRGKIAIWALMSLVVLVSASWFDHRPAATIGVSSSMAEVSDDQLQELAEDLWTTESLIDDGSADILDTLAVFTTPESERK